MRLQLRDGETAVVGYGSLLSRPSVEKTLKRAYQRPFVPCHVEGWRRSWDVAMPNQAFYYVEEHDRIYPQEILYLNVRPLPASLLNVVLFVVTSDEVATMHQREWIYDPVVVTDRLRGVQVEGGNAILYVAKREYVRRDAQSPREAAIRASYLRILDHGLQERDSAFRDTYAGTTDPVPEHLVVEDTLDPDRQNPWQVTPVSRSGSR